MPVVRSGLLAAWTSAWFAGSVSLDEVVDAVTGTDARHQVAGLADTVGPSTLGDALVALRRTGAPARVVLAVAGDVRGLPGPPTFRDAALDVGEALVCGAVGLVPEAVDFGPSSAPTSVRWQAYDVGVAPGDFVAVLDAQYDLTTAIRDTASTLAAADVAGHADPRALLDARRAGEDLDLPRGFPPRAVALLAQAERMQAVLDLALADPAGGAVDRFSMSARESALRPLVAAVRRSRIAGYNAGAAT